MVGLVAHPEAQVDIMVETAVLAAAEPVGTTLFVDLVAQVDTLVVKEELGVVRGAVAAVVPMPMVRILTHPPV